MSQSNQLSQETMNKIAAHNEWGNIFINCLMQSMVHYHEHPKPDPGTLIANIIGVVDAATNELNTRKSNIEALIAAETKAAAAPKVEIAPPGLVFPKN